LLVSVGMGSLKRYWPVCVGSAKRSVAECGRGALRGASSTTLPPLRVQAEGAGARMRPGPLTAATLAAKFLRWKPARLCIVCKLEPMRHAAPVG
jgi:hypothetical protein